MARESKSFGTQRAYKQHLLLGKGGVAGEVADLRNDVEEGFQNNEQKAGFPTLDWVDGGAFAAAGANVTLIGTNLLQGQTFDTLQIKEGAAQIDLHAMKPGDSGITVEVVAGTGALAVAYAAKKLTITLAAGGSTDDAVATAVNEAASQAKGIVRAVSAGGGSFTAAVAETAMAGGVGYWEGNAVMVSGVEALPAHQTGTTPAASWTDDGIGATVPDLTGESPARAAGDIAGVIVMSNGVKTDQLSVVLA
jgi:hypothetical protein